MKEEAVNRIKLHVDQVKREKANTEPNANLPGIEMLYEKYSRDNAYVDSALKLWERYPDISIEQALVSLVDVLVRQNDSQHNMLLDMVQNSTRPVVIGGSVTGTRIITGNNNNVRDNS